MVILTGKNRYEKTAYAIEQAYKNNALIVTGTRRQARDIKHMSIQMDMPVNVYAYRYYKKLYEDKGVDHVSIGGNNVIIDQLEDVIAEAFKYDKVTIATTGVDFYANSKWKKVGFLGRGIKKLLTRKRRYKI